MKKIICYLDESTNTVYQNESKLWLLGSVDPTGNTPVVPAEDIIKMKHGGVI